MASISSSVINKSGKRFAPKVPARRGGPAAARKPNADAQASSQQPPPAPAIDRTPPPPPEATEAAQPPSLTTAVAPSSPRPPQISKPAQSKNHSVPIPVPAPKRKSPIPASQPASGAVPISPSPKAPTITAKPQQPARPQSSQSQIDGRESNKRTSDGQERSVEGGPATRSDNAAEDLGDVPPAKRIRITDEATPGPSTRGTTDVITTTEPTPTSSPQATPKGTKKSVPNNKVSRPRAKQRKSAQDAAEEVVGDAVQKKPRTRRKREATPENAESREILSGVVKMSDLCKDIRIGKKSKRETELQSMDGAESARKRKEREESRKKEGTGEQRNASVEKPASPVAPTRNPAPASGPQMRIVNGEIVLDASSLQIDRHADAARTMDDMEEVEENPLTRKINSSSFGKRTKAESWDEELTELFYRGLRMFGTDFMMISKLFPGRTRRHIKLKFSNEERRNPQRIGDTLLGPREPVSLEAYSDMTNTVYDDPRVIEQELEQEKKNIEEQHAQEKEAREELLRHPNADSNVLPSVEDGDNGKRRRGDGKKGANTKSGGAAGGMEEILGTIDD